MPTRSNHSEKEEMKPAPKAAEGHICIELKASQKTYYDRNRTLEDRRYIYTYHQNAKNVIALFLIAPIILKNRRVSCMTLHTDVPGSLLLSAA
ncbi:MAG TPA: hypothetical protein VFZ67_02130 [Nitrososphaera sp.]